MNEVKKQASTNHALRRMRIDNTHQPNIEEENWKQAQANYNYMKQSRRI